MLDAVIVGAGPGGIATSYALIEGDGGRDVVMVDSGRGYDQRHCPVDAGHHCKGCGGICNVISGFGGCMHYGDGIKLSLMPSGRRLLDLLGDEAHQLGLEALALITDRAGVQPQLVGHRVEQAVLDTFADFDLDLRQYPVAVLSESQLRTALEGLYRDLSGRVDIRMKSAVTDITPVGGGYSVRAQTRTGKMEFPARNVVLATGRSGLVSTQRLIRGLDIPMVPPNISVGVRFEMAAEFLRATGVAHPDMKVTQRRAGLNKIKTFCFCGGSNGGRIKFTNYQTAFGEPVITLDGHETVERQHGDRPLAGNFGLLCQTTPLDDHSDRSAYLEREILQPYRDLSQGRPVVQTFEDFRRRRTPRGDWATLSDGLSFEPSVHDLSVAPVHSLFTEEQIDSLVDGFLSIMRPMLALADRNLTVDDIASEILVIGLEIEFLWSHVQIDETVQTPRKGIYVVGDTAGIAQGVIQAMIMGLRAGRSIASTSGFATVGGKSGISKPTGLSSALRYQ